jgi:hypothetical protein
MLNILNDEKSDDRNVSTSDIAWKITQVCQDMDITDEGLKSADVQKIGTLLGRLGFVKSSTHGSQRSWNLTRSMILEKAKVNGITLEELEQPVAEEKVAAAVADDDWFKTPVKRSSGPLPW